MKKIKRNTISMELLPSSAVDSELINDDDGDKKKNASVTICLIVFWLYCSSFSLCLPAFPSLLLSINHGDSSLASYYYGLTSCLRFFLEFFSNSFLGNLSDSYGRKPILILSFISVIIEYLSLAIVPSITTIFLVNIITGLGNCSITMGYCYVSDIAYHNKESMTNNFGKFSAVFGLAFITGKKFSFFWKLLWYRYTYIYVCKYVRFI